MKLRPYQDQCIQAILDAAHRGVTRQLVVLPTGGGKTIIFAELLRQRKDLLPALVLAHREELLEQAKDKILNVNPELRVEIEQGERRATSSADVVVGSVPSLGRATSRRLETYPRDHFGIIICDEAHHSAATTYKRVFDYYERDGQLRLGVTATPQRGDNIGLSDVYDEVVYYKSIEELIDDGYLCQLRGYRVESDCDISSVGTRAGDYIDSALAKTIDTPKRNQLIVSAYQKLVQGSKCLVFASSVEHGKNIERAFRSAGINAGSIFGESSSTARNDVLQSFRRSTSDGCNKDLSVLVNCGVLTEGFDEPTIECIMLARPTRSALLYTQIVGRGTRLSPGKDFCTIIDIADVTRSKKPYGLPSLLGLPSDFDLAGETLLAAVSQFRELEEMAPGEAARVKSLEDIEAVYKQIDIFRPPPASAAVLEFSNFIWAEVGPNNFYLGVSPTESLHLYTDALGRYHSILKSKDNSRESTRELGVTADIREAFARSDRWVIANRQSRIGLLDSGSVWRKDSPTEKQIKWLTKFGVPITNEMTKGEASQILDKLFADNKKPKRPAWLEKKIANQKKSGWF